MKKALILFSILMLLPITFVLFEPSDLMAADASDQSVITLTVTSQITISDGADVTMGTLNITNSTSTGTTAWTVTTNNQAGYKLEVASSQQNPLRSADTSEQFADYAEASGTTPEVWNTTDGAYEFGFSAYGDNVPTGTWGTGATCGSGTTINQSMKYRGFNVAGDAAAETVQIATLATETGTAGVTTNFCLGAVQSHIFAPAGTYTATTTATATTL